MVEGADAKPYREPEGAASTYNAVGLGDNVQQPQHAAAAAADDDNEGEALLNKLPIPRNLPSIVDIKRVLPQHVFDPQVSTSMYYAARDIVQVVVLFLVAEWLWSSGVLPLWCLLLLLPIYWLLQGTFFTAIFVIGHDAGHSSFSHHEWLNTVVGNVFHTFLLCPYYCWKLSHRQHHKNTGNIDKDEVFYPIRKKQDTGNYTLPGFGLGIGWFAYLLTGYGPRPVNHFNPWHPALRRHALHCLLSVALVLGWGSLLWHYMLSAGALKLLVHYVVPEMVFASYTVVITFLHHTEEGIPWYSDALWDNVRGQLSSVDRHYGWCHGIIHSIGTHQVHHLFSKMPHYHLEEATQVFRRRFPRLVQVRNDAIMPAFCRMFAKYLAQCVVPDNTKVHLYQ
ncbi:sn-1 acyl-lipid omega-3 desaturase (ferredoxin)-like [Babylonia areolata]|uniref:sn-1 acyl-lipid omega-3 desaturase (ferredoxin)-like n=1 Tax=Babylonia areolata TaxID=304850 RepID=UPI003FD41C60